jgi:hypothetical protein
VRCSLRGSSVLRISPLTQRCQLLVFDPLISSPARTPPAAAARRAASNRRRRSSPLLYRRTAELSHPAIMGVPKFFRWLAERYPLVNKYINETLPPDFGEGTRDLVLAVLISLFLLAP